MLSSTLSRSSSQFLGRASQCIYKNRSHEMSRFMVTTLSGSAVVRGVKQRKTNLAWKNPFDMLEEYKKKMESVSPSLDDENIPPMKTIDLYSVFEEQNARRYEKLKEEGRYPLDEILQEEPSVQEYIDWVKQGKPQPGEWNPKTSRRTGIIGVKMGMLPLWDEYYERVVCTAVYVPPCQVIQKRTVEKDGINALQVGAGNISLRKVTRPMMGHFARAGVEPKHGITQFRVSEDCLLPEGTDLTVRHFTPGQYVDVIGRSTGKGFQGGMKRWGFGGLLASHGTSVAHRSLGSTGSVGMGKVIKGKKMAGRMGGKKVTQRNNFVYMLDIKRNVIFIRGQLPGTRGAYLLLKDAERKPPANPPYPTFYPPEDEDLSGLSDKECFITYKRSMPQEWKDTDMTEEEIWKVLNTHIAEIERDERRWRRRK